jgi:diaminohydroxyphosphoribosylaminopyrimidine deaminase/5-amino-6-(5-phosphoribosylamino)uracil reductase
VTDELFMRRALALARRALGDTSPNPLVGAVLVRRGEIVGEGWHRRAGEPHAEIEALRDAERRGGRTAGATLYVTLEPCSTQGRTPPCTDALVRAGVRRVVIAATDPNPRHAGRGFDRLREAGIEVLTGVLADEATRMNLGFNHWILHRTPLVTLKAAMSLDGRIATVSGESQWLTGEKARACGQRLRRRHDAILAGINTVLADDPALTIRRGKRTTAPLRVILDTRARTPRTAQVVADAWASRTLVVCGPDAPARRLEALRRQVEVLVAPRCGGRVDLQWLLAELGGRGITSLLVEGGGEVHASFLEGRLAHRLAFFYAPLVLGGREASRAVAGSGFASRSSLPELEDVRWRRLGADLLLEARLTDFREGTGGAELPSPGERRLRRRSPVV